MRNSEAIRVYLWSSVLVGVGVFLLCIAVLAGCQAHSRITAATANAERQTESRGPWTELVVRGRPLKREAAK